MADPLFAGGLIPNVVVVATEPPHVPSIYAGTATELYLRYVSGTATVVTVTIKHYNQAGSLQNSQAVAMGSAVFKSQSVSWTVAKNDYFEAVVDTVTKTVDVVDLVWQVRP